MEVINAVKHYQRSIERCSGNVERMLHCLQKLYCLPVTVQHLQETGVGRTVNALRKYEGDTGEAAKALVNKWKAMVAEAETSDEEVSSESHRTRTESPPPTSTSHRHKSSHSESRRDESHAEKTKSLHKNHSSSSHSEKRRDENSTSYRSSKHSDHGHKRRHEEEKRRTEEKRRRKNVEEEEEQEEEEEDEDEEKEHVSDSGHESHEEIENEESDHISVADSDSSNVRDAENEDNEEASEDEDNEEASEEVEDTEEVAQEEETETEYVAVKMKHKSHGSKHNGISHSSHSFHSEKKVHSSPSDSRSRNSRDRHERPNTLPEKSNYSVDHKHNKKNEERRDSSKTENRSSSNSSSRVHHHEESKSRSKEKETRREKEKNREREKNEIRKREEVKKESKEQRKDQKSKSHIPKNEPKPSTSSSKSSSNAEGKTKSSSSKKPKSTVKSTEDGIDSFSGTSFADALGMMGMIEPANKKKKKQSSGGSSSSRKSDTSSGNQISTSTQSNQKTKEVSPQKLQPKASASTDDINLLDPSLKLEPLDHLEMEMEVDVDATLPAITPNYRPLPHLNFDLPSRARARSLTEEEALSQVMSTKNQRTKVYSGVKSGKSWATVPSLYDICVRVLQENIDALEYTGGVPFDLLKPVLTHATPEQLFTLEHYNPYLVEDTDELWQSHVRRKFRNQRRHDMETHREMFQRCVEENEAKLKALTLNIQNSMAKSVPVRQTKLAYVDSIAKPPRQVARKQAKFGTAHATATTPMAKVQKLATPAGSSAGRSSSPVVHVPAPRTSHSTAKTKPRMAPLMQKTMKLAKSFKR